MLPILRSRQCVNQLKQLAIDDLWAFIGNGSGSWSPASALQCSLHDSTGDARPHRSVLRCDYPVLPQQDALRRADASHPYATAGCRDFSRVELSRRVSRPKPRPVCGEAVHFSRGGRRVCWLVAQARRCAPGAVQRACAASARSGRADRDSRCVAKDRVGAKASRQRPRKMRPRYTDECKSMRANGYQIRHAQDVEHRSPTSTARSRPARFGRKLPRCRNYQFITTIARPVTPAGSSAPS